MSLPAALQLFDGGDSEQRPQTPTPFRPAWCRTRNSPRTGLFLTDPTALDNSPSPDTRIDLMLGSRFSVPATLVLAAFLATAIAAAAPPNIVFFLADDLGWRDLGCYGSQFYETPNIDALAESGARFTQAYAACPVCSPTRASIMTGKYPVRIRVTDYISPRGGNQPEQWNRNTALLPSAYSDRMPLEEVTLAEAFKESGYATFFAGKWHLGPEGFWPQDQGFDENKGGWEHGGPWGGDNYFSPYGNPNLPDGREGEYLPERLARETVRFIDEHRDEPFLAYLSFYSVHTPLMTTAALEQKYAAKAKQLAFSGPRWIRESFRDARQVQDHAIYGGMVEALDSAVGQVLQAISANGLHERTIVVFMSDNGGLSTSEGSPTANLPLRGGKGWMYEGGIREPMLIRGPGVGKPGTVIDTPVTSTDFYPTLLELAGLRTRPDQHVDGASLVPLLRGERMRRAPLYWHYPHYGNQGGAPSGAIRAADWKLIKWYEDGSTELYNLGNDPGERYDLSKLNPRASAGLERRLDAWLQQVDANMPSSNPAYDGDNPSGRLPPNER